MIPERSVAEDLMMRIRKFVPHESDCYTLLCDFYEKCYGIEIPRYEYESIKQEKPPDRAWEDWRYVDRSEARPGDVVVFYSDLGMHLGILLDEGEFLHMACVGAPPCRIGKISELSAHRIEFVRYRQIDNH